MTKYEMTEFEKAKFTPVMITEDGWIWKVTHCGKWRKVLVEFENRTEKILEIIFNGGDPNLDLISKIFNSGDPELINKAIAFSEFKKMALS